MGGLYSRSYRVRRTLLNNYKNLNIERDALGELANASPSGRARLSLGKLRDVVGLDYLELRSFAALDPMSGMQLDVHTDRFRFSVEEFVERGLANNDPMMDLISQNPSIYFASKVFKASKSRSEVGEIVDLMTSFNVQNYG